MMAELQILQGRVVMVTTRTEGMKELDSGLSSHDRFCKFSHPLTLCHQNLRPQIEQSNAVEERILI